MRSRRFWGARPGLALAGAALLAAMVLGIVRFRRSNHRHDVTLSLGTPALESAAIGRIASELERTLGRGNSDHDSVRRRVADPRGACHGWFRARYRAHRGRIRQRASGAGDPASVQVEPRREHVSTNLIARAMDRVVELRIERAGRSLPR